MNSRSFPITLHSLAFMAFLFFFSCDNSQSNADPENASGNILLAEFTGPYGGVPAFDKMEVADIQAAMEEGMAKKLDEIDGI